MPTTINVTARDQQNFGYVQKARMTLAGGCRMITEIFHSHAAPAMCKEGIQEEIVNGKRQVCKPVFAHCVTLPEGTSMVVFYVSNLVPNRLVASVYRLHCSSLRVSMYFWTASILGNSSTPAHSHSSVDQYVLHKSTLLAPSFARVSVSLARMLSCSSLDN